MDILADAILHFDTLLRALSVRGYDCITGASAEEVKIGSHLSRSDLSFHCHSVTNWLQKKCQQFIG